MRCEITIDPAEVERALLEKIDREAEQVRALFITNTPSQPAVYLQKESEARAYMENPDIDDAEIPNIAREAVRTGTTKAEVAANILALAQQWRQISAEIEDLRLAAKDAVRAAQGVKGKRQAAIVDWSPIIALAN